MKYAPRKLHSLSWLALAVLSGAFALLNWFGNEGRAKLAEIGWPAAFLTQHGVTTTTTSTSQQSWDIAELNWWALSADLLFAVAITGGAVSLLERNLRQMQTPLTLRSMFQVSIGALLVLMTLTGLALAMRPYYTPSVRELSFFLAAIGFGLFCFSVFDVTIAVLLHKGSTPMGLSDPRSQSSRPSG